MEKVEQHKQTEEALKAVTKRLEIKNEIKRRVMLMRALIFLTECVTNEDVFCVGWLQVYLDRQDHNEINLSLTRDIFKYDENEEYLYE
ncbi:hypothetical protein [Bartonella bovis]|uniref:hypothetical protein n=1 Tax=Bartonella bovis TaxID=155194 RepID=UPI0011AF77EA|nr:hypothetical protein [Bartonella bovis]